MDLNILLPRTGDRRQLACVSGFPLSDKPGTKGDEGCVVVVVDE